MDNQAAKRFLEKQKSRWMEIRECDYYELTSRMKKAERERDELRARLAKSEAVCAEMRGALEAVLSRLTDYLNTISMVDEEAKFQAVAECIDRTKAVLSSSAGKDLLERVRLLEAVREAAERFVKASCEYDGDPKNIEWENEACDAEKALENALDAIDAYLKRGEKDA